MTDQLFSITLYEDGALQMRSKNKCDDIAAVLRIIADSLEAGTTKLAVIEND